MVTIWIGANNYLFGDASPFPVVDDIADAVERLATNTGARRFVVVNMPDLGDTPLGVVNPALAGPLNQISEAHNAVLQGAMAALADATGLDIVVIISYLLIILGFGTYFGRFGKHSR